MSINVFRSMTHSLRQLKVITARTITFQQINDWAAYKLLVSEKTEINGFAFNLSATPTGSFNVSVGISTALSLNGLFPYVISQEFMNSNVGTAKTIGFEYEISTTINGSSLSGLGYDNLSFISSATGYTLEPFTPYWVGMKINTVNSAGSFLCYDMGALTAGDNIICSYQDQARFQRLASAVGVTATSDFMMTVPFYYNSATGKTEYYNKYPVIVEDISRRYDANTSGREFGIKFEFNNFPFQDWEVYSMTFDWIRYGNTAGYTPDPQFCLRIYDGANYENVVGTAITVTGYDFSPVVYNAPAEYEFLFNPPIKLRTNKSYFAGIAWTHPTTQPNSNAFIMATYNYKDLQSDQSTVFAYRNTIGSGAITEVSTMKLPLNMYLKRTNSVSRAIGN